MRFLVRTLILASLVATVSAHSRVEAIPARPLHEPEALRTTRAIEGMWQQVHGEFQGEVNRGDSNRWRITNDTITILGRTAQGDQNLGSWNYRIDFSKNPATLDLTPTNLTRPVTYPCVIHVEGNRLTVCLQNYPDRGRPHDFISRPNSGIGKYVYEKIH